MDQTVNNISSLLVRLGQSDLRGRTITKISKVLSAQVTPEIKTQLLAQEKANLTDVDSEIYDAMYEGPIALYTPNAEVVNDVIANTSPQIRSPLMFSSFLLPNVSAAIEPRLFMEYSFNTACLLLNDLAKIEYGGDKDIVHIAPFMALMDVNKQISFYNEDVSHVLFCCQGTDTILRKMTTLISNEFLKHLHDALSTPVTLRPHDISSKIILELSYNMIVPTDPNDDKVNMRRGKINTHTNLDEQLSQDFIDNHNAGIEYFTDVYWDPSQKHSVMYKTNNKVEIYSIDTRMSATII